MSIYGPKAVPPPRARPDPPPEHAFIRIGKQLAVLAVAAVFAIVALYLASESEEVRKAQVLERAETIRRDVQRMVDPAPLQSFEILFRTPDPPKVEPIEPLQSADIIP